MPLTIQLRPPPPPLPEGFKPPKPLPSITEQTPWPVGFYNFRDEGDGFQRKVEYFNCSLIHRNGFDWLITRKRVERTGPPGHNSLVAWRLVDNVPVQDIPIYIQGVYQGENWEDPRITQFGNEFVLSWCNFKWNSVAHQCVGTVTDRWLVPKVHHPVYGKNGPHLMANTGHEKNWIWFDHEGVLHLIYTTAPHRVCETRNFTVTRQYDTPGAGHLWTKWGEMRGGTPPVRIGDEYFAFFHSSNKWIPPRRRYHMGCYAFEAKPPFRVTRVSKKPILSGSENDQRNSGAPVVTFPTGVIHRDGKWLVVGGSNDCKCFWTLIPHDELLKTLRKV